MSYSTELQNEWNAAYNRGGNLCFYPHEEIVRFINRYVRKRISIKDFANLMNLQKDEWENFASLDLGCGIGRHVVFLDEFGLNPYGIDLSDDAINMGKSWVKSIGKDYLEDHLLVGSVTELPFEDGFFNICVSAGVLDSMPRNIAETGLNEVYRVLKSGGLMYLDLIMDDNRGNVDEIVQGGYEENTVQSYFSTDKIYEFIGNKADVIDFQIITHKNLDDKVREKRAHLIIRKNS